MIFKRLVENLPKIPKNATLKFNRADSKTQKEIIQRVLNAYNDNDLLNKKGVFKSTYDSALHYGLDPDANPWLQFLDKKNFKIDNTLDEVLPLIFQTHIKSNIDLLQDFMLNDLLKIDYNKSTKEDEIIYTLRLLDTVYNKDKLRQFFHDPQAINTDELHQNNDPRNYYKRAGIGKHGDPETLFGTVELWSEGNEVDRETKELTINELRRLKDMYKNNTLDEIEKTLRNEHQLKDNTVVFASNKEHNSNPQSVEKMSDPNFWIWDDGKKQWDKYITEKTKKVLNER